MPTRIVAGRYRLLSELGRGGMGVVWGALDEVLGREVAVKEVRAPAGLDEHGVRQLYARLEQEGRAAARVEHPNVITVYDVAMAEGSPWIVMELVRGLTLSDVLSAEGPLEPRRAAQICGRVLAGLRAAHEKGVLHRDVKPGNVLIGDDGRVVLTDFGIATFEGSSALTRTGELVGSPEFLPPERALGRTPGPESDLWSLGVLLFVSVEGDSPFRRDTALSTMRAVVEEEPPVPRRAKPLVPVLEGLLRKDPARRLSGWEAQRILDEVAAGRTPYSAPTVVGIRAPAAPFTPPSARAHASPAAAARAITARGRRKRPRRAVAAMAAGVLALLLAAGGIAWALTHNGGGGRSVNGTGTVVGGGAARTTGPSTTTGDGGSSDPGWKTAGFPTSGAKSRTVAHTELSYLSDLRSASVGVRIDGDDIAVPRLSYTAVLNTGR